MQEVNSDPTSWLWSFVPLIGICFYGLLIWFAVRAKPLGNIPYRWATFCAIISGFIAIGVLFPAIGIMLQRGIDFGLIGASPIYCC